MIAIIKGDNGGASGGITSDFDSIFDGLCSAVKKKSLFCEIARCQLYDSFSKRNIWFVHHHAKAGMCEPGCLFSDSFRHLWPGVANIHGADATCEVDIAITIYIFDDGSICFRCKYVHRG